MFRYATAFFKFEEERILNCRDYISANTYLRELGAKMVDAEKLSLIAFHGINPFPIRMINAKRAMYLDQVKVSSDQLRSIGMSASGCLSCLLCELASSVYKICMDSVCLDIHRIQGGT